MQLNLDLDLRPIVRPNRARLSTQAAFLVFNEANPHVYNNLVALTRMSKRSGRSRIGICLLYEKLRWEYSIKTDHAEGDFKLPNNYKPYYARMIMMNNPDLAGMFQINRLQCEMVS